MYLECFLLLIYLRFCVPSWHPLTTRDEIRQTGTDSRRYLHVLLVLWEVKFHVFLPLWDKKRPDFHFSFEHSSCSQLLISKSDHHLRRVRYVQGEHSKREQGESIKARLSRRKTNALPWKPDWFHWSAPQQTFCNQTCLKQGTAWEGSFQAEPQEIQTMIY